MFSIFTTTSSLIESSESEKPDILQKMSFSPFEDFLDLPSEYESSGVDSSDVAAAAELDHSLSMECETTTVVSSANGENDRSYIHETLSLSSDTLQDFGSMVSLPPGTLAGLLERFHDAETEESEVCTMSTIVSSAPSGSYIPTPEASNDVWAISPHPQLVSGSALSTVCTETLSYQKLHEDMVSVISGMDEEDNRSVSSIARQTARTSTHDRVVFEAIANQLLHDIPGNRRIVSSGVWYSRFTEFDWDQLREVAKVVVAAAGPPVKLLPLPPSPPRNARRDCTEVRMESYKAEDLLPSNFICPCCKDVIVGALALDCGCTLCAACCDVDDFLPIEIAEQEGFVWIDQNICPSCRSPIITKIPCQALDVAILHIIEKMDSSRQNNKAQCMKLAYYTRLESWRQTVLQRNHARLQQQAMNEDEMLARLIEEEEKMLWGKNKVKKNALSISTQSMLILGQATVALLAATLSSFALQAFARRR